MNVGGFVCVCFVFQRVKMQNYLSEVLKLDSLPLGQNAPFFTLLCQLTAAQPV